MKEEFLGFIWKNQYFNKHKLETSHGEPLQVIHPGILNHDAGPDFSQARIKIGNTEWVGAVEIHIKSSEWWHHKHHLDRSYDQVILHVVWTNNRQVGTIDGRSIPTLELKHRVDEQLLLNQQRLSSSRTVVPCHGLIRSIPAGILTEMMSTAIEQRVKRKAHEVIELLNLYHQDWDQLTYIMLGKSFGFNINAAAFEHLTTRVPLSVVRKIRYSLFQIESLYFGQAGFLEKVSGFQYYRKLQKEYFYLKKKFSLPAPVRTEMWKFLRVRPSNFPLLRIAQLASLVQQGYFNFSDIRECPDISKFTSLVIYPSDYWKHHYHFGKPSKVPGGKLGRSSLENLAINVITPVLAGYGLHTGQSRFFSQVLHLLEQLPAEKNQLIANWKDWGFGVSSAFDSQALIELNNHFCTRKKCLDCQVGQHILTRDK